MSDDTTKAPSSDKHTGGPWQAIINERTRPHTALVATFAKADRVMAIECDRSGVDAKEDIANANLVAAAPDLLDACRRSLGAFDALRTIGADAHLPGFARVLSAINAAIAKAEGK